MIVYRKGNQELICEIPYIQVGNYTLDELKDKHLYMLFPFYIIRYEHAIKYNIDKKYKLIEKEAERVYNILTEAYNDGILNKQEYEHVVTLYKATLENIKNAMSNGNLSFDKVCELLGVKDREQYRKYI